MEERGFDTEGTELNGDYVLIYPIAEEWMDVMRTMTNAGKCIEIYGGIEHEHGAMECYALTDSGERYAGLAVYEADEPQQPGPAEIQATFLAMVPEQVMDLFPSVFGS